MLFSLKPQTSQQKRKHCVKCMCHLYMRKAAILSSIDTVNHITAMDKVDSANTMHIYLSKHCFRLFNGCLITLCIDDLHACVPYFCPEAVVHVLGSFFRAEVESLHSKYL